MQNLFPAYAGVIPVLETKERVTKAFPRLRGGDPRLFTDICELRDFSPPTRG